MSNEPGLVPELTVTDYEASRRFWCDLVGFSLRYERPEEGFGYLVLGNAHLMLDQIDRGRTVGNRSPLICRLAGGINLEVQTEDAGQCMAPHGRGRVADLRRTRREVVSGGRY